jgi:hypothetical protein
MPAWEFEYTTPLMPRECRVIKYADTPEKALAFFAKGTIKANNLVIHKSKSPMTLTKEPIIL